MTLWLSAVTPIFFPRFTSSQIIRAPVYVFPDPGGPWIANTESSSANTIRFAVFTVVSEASCSSFSSFRRPRRPSQQQISSGAIVSCRIDSVFSDPRADPVQ